MRQTGNVSRGPGLRPSPCCAQPVGPACCLHRGHDLTPRPPGPGVLPPVVRGPAHAGIWDTHTWVSFLEPQGLGGWRAAGRELGSMRRPR